MTTSKKAIVEKISPIEQANANVNLKTHLVFNIIWITCFENMMHMRLSSNNSFDH